MSQEIIFKVSPDLLESGQVSLNGEIQDLFAPLARRKVILVDPEGNSLPCRVNSNATVLTGQRLEKFFTATCSTDIFSITPVSKAIFLVRPVVKHKYEQMSLFPEHRSTTLNTKAPISGNNAGDPGISKKERINTPFKRTQNAKALDDPASKYNAYMHLDPVELAKSSVGKTKRNAQIKTKTSTPLVKKITEVKNSGRPVAAHKAVEKPSPSQTTSICEEPVKINFYPEEDKSILSIVSGTTKKHITPVEDFFIHQQALLLSLSPGFDRLLSLSAVRNVQFLNYQLTSVRHVLKNLRGRALLCDEVGLGKTIEAGLIMLEYILRGLVRRVLVLVPPSLIEQWQQELQTKFNLDFVTHDDPMFKHQQNPWSNFDRIIASLDTAKREPHRTQVLDSTYDLVIVDEAHHLKNYRTQAYQLVNLIKKKYILLLTATPVENNLEELFNLITLLQPGQLETASSFKRKYITRGDPLKPKNTQALRQLVREIMIRNRRSETGVIISRRHAEIVELELSPEEIAFYRRLSVFVREHYTLGEKETNSEISQFVLKILQREVGSSIEAVLPTLEKMAANQDYPPVKRRLFHALAEQARGVPRRKKAEVLLRLLASIPEKVIIFTSFMHTQSFLVRLLRDHGYVVAELHGGMRRLQKEEQLRLFIQEARVLVSTETGSEGRNLHFCRVMINYDLPWNPMRIEQRIGRIHRLGQTEDVMIYNISAAETVENYILELLDAKINMFQLVIGELDMILGNLKEKRDFEDLIMDIWSSASSETELKANIEELGKQLIAAKEHYLTVKELDDRLLGGLKPENE